MKKFIAFAALCSLTTLINSECHCEEHAHQDHVNLSDTHSVGKEVDQKTVTCMCDRSKCLVHSTKQKTEEIVDAAKKLATKAGQFTKGVVSKAGNTIKDILRNR